MLDEAPHRLDSAIEVDRGQHRFEEIREERVLLPSARLFFANTEIQHLAHTVIASLRGQARSADEVRLHLRQGPFVQFGETAEEKIADDETEDSVAEKLEGLVVAQ